MSSSEPIDFMQERRKRRPSEEVGREEQAHLSSGEQKRPTTSQSQSEPDQKQVERQPEPKQGPRCSCCQWPQEKVLVFLDLGQGRLLCDGCIHLCTTILSEEGIAPDIAATPKQTIISPVYKARTNYWCSFCGKRRDQVARLIAMLNNLFICNGCVGICNANIAQTLLAASTKAGEVVHVEKPMETHP